MKNARAVPGMVRVAIGGRRGTGCAGPSAPPPCAGDAPGVAARGNPVQCMTTGFCARVA